MTDVLSSRVLVLNRNYSPIAITTVKDAFIKLFGQIAEVITIEDGTYCSYDFSSWAEISELKHELEELLEHDEVIHTPSLTLVVPRIIRILTYSKIPLHRIKLTRRNVYARDNNTCQYCGKKFKTEDLNLDHVNPKTKGGTTTWENIVCSCYKCNGKKGPNTPDEAGMKLIRKPKVPRENPSLRVHIGSPKYSSWKSFVSNAYWTTEITD